MKSEAYYNRRAARDGERLTVFGGCVLAIVALVAAGALLRLVERLT